MPFPVACTGDKTDPEFGPPNVIASITTTVLAHGRPVATVGAIVAPHGNYYDPYAPGYNNMCEGAKIAVGVPNILVMGLPIARIDPEAMCTCGLHYVLGPGDPTVMVGP
jgi:uncharacterized Zn-binding protein involved in type VI secretion